ncbi:alpha/beta hydrolase fold domain-containing protein [Mucilaginibacter sp. McL0603]|uniref:alpha/beta hydrolase fold domain-containing protein n=1 Tax=Mucilaginibacter sp. McL0603 TaxID=3415670 RepID=UPI003CF006D7
MKKVLFLIGCALTLLLNHTSAQTFSPIKDVFPTGTIPYDNIPYANDTLKKHLLDIYLPPTGKSNYPVVIWVHGGAWMSNDKYADMGYMKNTLKGFIDSGYAVASIDYRWSTMAVFPAQIQDCNQAVEFLYQNAAKYKLDKDRFALIGFSAGGHLASLLGLSNNKNVKDFYHDGKKPGFKIKLVLDFYGPSDLLTLKGNDIKDPRNPITLLLGGMVADNTAKAKKASPVTYIDKNDPPFLIVQGEKDESVNPDQSISLSQHLKDAGVKNDLIIVPNAPHYGEMFDAPDIRKKIFEYLSEFLK